jgi:ABC-type nickel/cobalt efflux system permease component RcnA
MLALLTLGVIFGLKHATEVDHVVAISTIVSQNRNLWRSALVGALWGAGHTAALLVTGIVVLFLRVAIPEGFSNWLEFVVALMILGLGVSALWRALRRGGEVHMHEHNHDGTPHVHVHFHEATTRHEQHSHNAVPPAQSARHDHAVTAIGIKPVVIGTIHGLAGSGALTLLVLTQIKSAWLGLLYLAVFGIGSIGGMLVMSTIIGLPFTLNSRGLTRLHYRLQSAVAALSIAFGLWYAYETGQASGLF